MKAVLFAGCGLLSATLVAFPEVTDVVVAPIGGSRDMQVTYTLSEDAIVTARPRLEGAELGGEAARFMTGDVNRKIAAGVRRSFVWQAGRACPQRILSGVTMELTAWTEDMPPDYCAVDISGGTEEQAYPIRYYADAASVPGGVTNRCYKTYLLLLRRIGPTDGNGFPMGSPSGQAHADPVTYRPHTIVHTRPYYIGVYELTEEQYMHLVGTTTGYTTYPSENVNLWATLPVERVSYQSLRGTNDGLRWPDSREPDATSILGILRAKTGLAFDLPTEAQWEYACRGGSTDMFYLDHSETRFGKDWRNVLLAIARFSDDGRSGATRPVGSYEPNAWGLYDMIGNVWEYCRDWWVADLATIGQTMYDPAGPTLEEVSRLNLTGYVIRGGSYAELSSRMSCAFRLGPATANFTSHNLGVRLAVDLD